MKVVILLQNETHAGCEKVLSEFVLLHFQLFTTVRNTVGHVLTGNL